jgi:hypothetical protein
VGHKLKSGKYVWGGENTFKSSPGVGEDSKQSVVIFGDMGKVRLSKFFEHFNFSQRVMASCGYPSKDSVIFEKYLFGKKKILKNYKN